MKNLKIIAGEHLTALIQVKKNKRKIGCFKGFLIIIAGQKIVRIMNPFRIGDHVVIDKGGK